MDRPVNRRKETQPVEKCKSEDVSHFPTGTTTKKSATSLDNRRKETQPVEKCKSEDVSHFPTGTTTKKSATSLDK
jgi:hypothetical protein